MSEAIVKKMTKIEHSWFYIYHAVMMKKSYILQFYRDRQKCFYWLKWFFISFHFKNIINDTTTWKTKMSTLLFEMNCHVNIFLLEFSTNVDRILQENNKQRAVINRLSFCLSVSDAQFEHLVFFCIYPKINLQ